MAHETWPGGYVHRDGKGRPTYVIRRRIDGERYKVSTRRRTLAGAMAELERFEKDPRGYRPTESDRLLLDGDLAVAYLDASREKGNSRAWLLAKRDLVTWWGEQLEGVDLRRLDVQVVDRALAATPTRRMHRIEVLKHLFTWLVRTGRLDADPLRDRLQVPAARPAQAKRMKAIPPGVHRIWMHAMGGVWRDALTVLGATGWHLTELDRFARSGAVEARGELVALVQPLTKGGEPLTVEVSPEVAEAGRRILAAGTLSHWSLRQAVRRTLSRSRRSGVALPPLAIGSYRHSVATWAIDAGAQVGAVADFLGHKSPRTTRRFYATHALIPRPKGI